MAATDVRIYADALVTAFLTATPVVFIIGSMVLATAFAARAGIEVIGRAADLFFPLFILAILTSLVLAAPQAWQNLSNLEPVLAGRRPDAAGRTDPVALTPSSWCWPSWSLQQWSRNGVLPAPWAL